MIARRSFVLGCLALTACGHASSSPSAETADAASPSTGTDAWTHSGSAWTRPQPALHAAVSIDANGASFQPSHGDWSFGLHARRVGRAGSLRALATTAPTHTPTRTEIDRGDGVREWFADHPSGIEHGFDLATRPEGAGSLEIDLDVDGLTASDEAEGRTIALKDAHGRRWLSYLGLVARDADGKPLASEMHATANGIVVRVVDEGARYPVVVDPLIEGALLVTFTSPDTATMPRFGAALSVDGTTALVGSPGGGDGNGSAVLYARLPAGWAQVNEWHGADIVGSSYQSEFGVSVALRGSYAIVGAEGESPTTASGYSGAAYVFALSGSTWNFQQRLAPVVLYEDWEFGGAVATDGTSIVVGAPEPYASQGNAYVYTLAGGTWSLAESLAAPDGVNNGQFGSSVAIDGDTIAVTAGSGAASTLGLSTGQRLYVFTSTSGSWTLQQEIQPPGVSPTLVYPSLSVALRGDTLVVGVPSLTVGSALNQGGVYVYARAGTTWTQQQLVTLPTGAQDDQFGQSVDFDGTTIAAGKLGSYSPTNATTTRFALVAGAWTSTQTLTGDAIDGQAVALSGTTTLMSVASASAWEVELFGEVSSIGEACTNDVDCASGFCADGVCCNAACTGACNACAQPGNVGTCVVVAAGQPASPRAQCGGAGTPCGGSCDGTSTACTFPKTGAACGAGCVGNTSSVCDSTGNCTAPSACAANLVCGSNNLCLTFCKADTDCVSGNDCTLGNCTPRRAIGVACTTPDQCLSGFCADGVCCGSACIGQCESCSEPGKLGTCTTITGSPRTGHPACTGGNTPPCAGTCDGKNSAACSYPPKTTACGTCAGSDIQHCDGAGACGAASPCAGNFACSTSAACFASCMSEGECAKGFACADDHCVPEVTWTCSSDGTQSIPSVTGAPAESCAPYACGADGTCNQSCKGDADCASGNTCDATTYATGVCRPPAAPTTATSSGCAIGARSRSTSDGACEMAIVGLVIAIASSRCRR